MQNNIVYNIDDFLKDYSLCLDSDEFINILNSVNPQNEISIEINFFHKIKEKKKLLDKNINNVLKAQEIYFKAKSIEKEDIQKSICLYESIINTNHNRDVLDRLIALYRKVKNSLQEIRVINYLIEEEQNKEHNRLEFLILKNPILENEIRNCYDNNLVFVEPIFGQHINFNKKIQRLTKRLEELKSNNI